MKKFILKTGFLIALMILAISIVDAQTTVTVGGGSADYSNLKYAFDDINSGNLIDWGTGEITLEIIDDCNETTPAILYESGYGGQSYYTAIYIYPTTSGLTVSGTLTEPLIVFDGATNVTLDGREYMTGSTPSLTVVNLSPGDQTNNPASTIKFVNSASDNFVKYCKIMGCAESDVSGTIFFSESGSGNGNDNNTIIYNEISGIDASTRPKFSIYSHGSSGMENSGNIISNNSIFDCFKKDASSSAIELEDYSTNFTISSNSFFETSTFQPTASTFNYISIHIDNTSGVGFIIENNYFGGTDAQCGGSSFSKGNGSDNKYTGIRVYAGTSTPTSLQNNTFKNLSWSNSLASSWTAIEVAAGDVNIGTSVGNNIGDNTISGSIQTNCGQSGMFTYGISILSGSNVSISNNIIGGITTQASNTAYANNFYAIYKDAFGGNLTVSSNVIGNASLSNSINTSSTSTSNVQELIGIYSKGTGTINISNNTIANLNNANTCATTSYRSLVQGIKSIDGTNTISNNTIHDLSIAAANNGTNDLHAVCGIICIGNTIAKTISNNTIYNLTNSYSSFAGYISGIYILGPTSSESHLESNHIYGLSATGASSTGAYISGLRLGTGNITTNNNIIHLAPNSKSTIYGIFLLGTGASDVFDIFHNTICLGGSVSSGTNKSYCLFSPSANPTRDIRNNVFVNNRSTTGATDYHYALWLGYLVTTKLTLDYNDYYASGTGAALGRWNNTNYYTIPLVTGMDANSLSLDPLFTEEGGNDISDYVVGYDFLGVATSVAEDYNETSRAKYTFGALELPVNKWKGSISNDCNTRPNWTASAIPVTDIIFDDNPVNHCYLDKDYNIRHIVNGQSTYKLITNGHKLSIRGELQHTNGAQIDASSSGSEVEFAGSSAQSIAAGTFVNDEVQTLTINNSNGVTLNGTLKVLNSIVSTSGRIDAFTNTPTIKYAGSAAQQIGTHFLDNKVTNLEIDNAAGVTINGESLTVDNTLTFTNGVLNTGTSGSSIIILSSSASSSGHGSGKYIDGQCRKIGNSAFTFPVGNSGFYAPISITEASGGNASDYFTARYIKATPPNPTTLNVDITNLSQAEYWELDRSGTNQVEVILSFEDSRSGGINNLNDLLVAHWDGSEWESYGNSSTTGTTLSGTITSFQANSFSPFTLGSSGGGSPLPVTLTAFYAECSGNDVRINWITSSEINIEKYRLERSNDGENWEVASIIKAYGNSNQNNTYSLVESYPTAATYYRLTSIANDGMSKIFDPIYVGCSQYQDLNEELSVYPNPAVGNVIINSELIGAQYKIINSQGRVIALGTIEQNNQNIDLDNVSSGLYQVVIEFQGMTFLRKLMVE